MKVTKLIFGDDYEIVIQRKNKRDEKIDITALTVDEYNDMCSVLTEKRYKLAGTDYEMMQKEGNSICTGKESYDYFSITLGRNYYLDKDIQLNFIEVIYTDKTIFDSFLSFNRIITFEMIYEKLNTIKLKTEFWQYMGGKDEIPRMNEFELKTTPIFNRKRK